MFCLALYYVDDFEPDKFARVIENGEIFGFNLASREQLLLVLSE